MFNKIQDYISIFQMHLKYNQGSFRFFQTCDKYPIFHLLIYKYYILYR